MYLATAMYSVRNKQTPTFINFWIFSQGYGFITDLKKLNVMHTLGPGCQMMDPFGLWWTIVYEIQNLSSFSRGRLNGGVKS